jgi:hypothetical protein
VPAPFPKVFGNGLLGRAMLNANLALIRVSRSLFSYQIYVEAETTPDVSFVLADSRRRSSFPAPNGASERPDARQRQPGFGPPPQ